MGQMASLVVVSPLMDRLGRRRPILIGSIIILVGVALQASAQNATMFIIGRVILGFGNNIQECSSLVLVSELAHPQHRFVQAHRMGRGMLTRVSTGLRLQL